jgi:hypothetical protein
VSDIETVVVDSLKALDPEWPIREAGVCDARLSIDPMLDVLHSDSHTARSFVVADRPLDRRVAAQPEYRVRARHRQAMAQEQVGTTAKSIEQSKP